MAVVMQTLVTNGAFVGGSRGAYIIRPATVPYLGIDYIQYLFLMMPEFAAGRVPHHQELHSRSLVGIGRQTKPFNKRED